MAARLRILARRDVGAGTGSDTEPLAVAGEDQAARPVPAAEALERDNLLARSGGLRLGVVLIALDRLGLADVEVAVLERQAVGTVQSLDDGLAFLALQHIDGAVLAARGIGEQDLVARAEQHHARHLEAFLVDLHLETGRDAEFGAFGLADHLRPVVAQRAWRTALAEPSVARRKSRWLLQQSYEQSATQDDSSEFHTHIMPRVTEVSAQKESRGGSEPRLRSVEMD